MQSCVSKLKDDESTAREESMYLMSVKRALCADRALTRVQAFVHHWSVIKQGKKPRVHTATAVLQKNEVIVVPILKHMRF